MTKTNVLALAAMLATIAGCGSKPEKEVYEKPLDNPTKVTLTQREYSTVVDITWEDNSDKELGYSIWMRDDSGQSEIAVLDPDVTAYTITEGLEAGRKYNIGVQAKGAELKVSSQIIYKNIEVFDYSSLPRISLEDSFTTTPTSVAVSYSIKNYSARGKNAVLSYGLCWSENAAPTVADGRQHGPVYKATMTQAVTSASMDHDKTYHLRGYVETEEHGVLYSTEELNVKLGEASGPIKLNWTEITPSGFPEDIKVYKTTDELNGRPFNAWYAIADVTKGNVEFRFEFGKFATLENWYHNDCYVMTNAGYFNMTTHETGDFSADKGKITLAKWADVPRGAFGVDREQKPYAFWTAKSGDQQTYYFNEPEPNILNVNSYNTVKENYPSNTFVFEPYYAMCAGPLLVKNGKVVTDVTMDGTDFVRNYEQVALDIFTNSSITPDRTAVGYTPDGKIILFVCDGRIKASRGASIVELAQLMLGLGCEGACNFDGGGSTAMTLNGKRINSLESNMSGGTENRTVGTVMGFYKKQ